MHWQVETYDYLQISTLKMLWKVVVIILCVVVRKLNGMDDIICICELDDEPQYTFQISTAKGTFNEGWFYYSLPKACR